MWQKLKALTFILIFLLLTDFVSAAARASFCKCTCKTNSTIIALDTPSNANNIDPGTSDSTSRDILTGTDAKPVEDDGRPHQRTCADCNRQFCLMYDLPKLDDCKSENRGREDEILATCFQRDSAKDQAVVYTFILLTVGLLAYAGIRPYIEKRMNPSRQDNTGYEQIPVRQTGLGTG